MIVESLIVPWWSHFRAWVSIIYHYWNSYRAVLNLYKRRQTCKVRLWAPPPTHAEFLWNRLFWMLSMLSFAISNVFMLIAPPVWTHELSSNTESITKIALFNDSLYKDMNIPPPLKRAVLLDILDLSITKVWFLVFLKETTIAPPCPLGR